MATTQTTKRKTTKTKRSTAAKKGAATRARSTAATSARRTKATAKRRVNQPRKTKQATGIAATAEFVGAKAGNVVQTGVLAGSKAAAAVTKRVAKIF
jgi:hypothetical protein